MNSIENIRQHFKALQQNINGHPLTYLDSAATTLKPDVVVDRISHFYNYEAANVHRGAHFLSDQATGFFESSRKTVQQFFNAKSYEEIIFTKGTTDGINLIVESYGQSFLHEGDEIVLTELEHHANLVPWQNLAQRKNLKIKFISVLPNGELDLNSIDKVINEKTKIVSFSGCSNTLGTITPAALIIAQAKSVGAVTIIDAAQLVAQEKIDVQLLDVDFLVFSAHKLFGPFGFGVLYGKKKFLEAMPPYQYGGGMISEVNFEKSNYNILPYRLEAGTPHIEGAVGLESAILFFQKYNIKDIFQHEQNLMTAAQTMLKDIQGIKFFGQAKHKAAVLSFNIEGIHHSDIGQILDQKGIAVRVGHLCTQPLLKKFNLTGTLRASFSIYNNLEDVNRLVEGVIKAQRMLS